MGVLATEEKIDPGRIAARPGEVRDKTHPHWIHAGVQAAGARGRHSRK
jgi:hypothetical protein